MIQAVPSPASTGEICRQNLTLEAAMGSLGWLVENIVAFLPRRVAVPCAYEIMMQ